MLQCAVMHKEPNLPELKEDPPQEDWNWSCQYSMLHMGDCEKCSHQVQCTGQALYWMSLSLNRVIELPRCHIEQEFQWGVNIGTRMCQEPSGLVDDGLHAASHMMAIGWVQKLWKLYSVWWMDTLLVVYQQLQRPWSERISLGPPCNTIYVLFSKSFKNWLSGSGLYQFRFGFSSGWWRKVWVWVKVPWTELNWTLATLLGAQV